MEEARGNARGITRTRPRIPRALFCAKPHQTRRNSPRTRPRYKARKSSTEHRNAATEAHRKSHAQECTIKPYERTTARGFRRLGLYPCRVVLLTTIDHNSDHNSALLPLVFVVRYWLNPHSAGGSFVPIVVRLCVQTNSSPVSRTKQKALKTQRFRAFFFV